MDTTITFPADPDLSDVRTMVLRWVEGGRGDSYTAPTIAGRLGLPTTCVEAVLESLVAAGLAIRDDAGYASAMQLLD